MRTETEQRTVPEAEPSNEPDFDRFASYDDDGALVVCDRKNPRAWIRSDATTPLDA